MSRRHSLRLLLTARRRDRRAWRCPSIEKRGFALIIALWTLTLVSMIAVSVIASSRIDQRIARNVVDRAEAMALADAGIAIGIAALISRPADDPWPLDGTFRTVSFAGRDLRVAIGDELGRIDLNAADDDRLLSLFMSAGEPVETARRMVGALLDWRDRDDVKRPHGAESANYQAIGLPYGPRNGAFETVDELAQVAGFSSAFVNRIRDAVTVHSHQAYVDPGAAPELVRKVLSIEPIDTGVESIRDTSAKIISGSRDGNGPAAATTSDIFDLTGRAFRITASARSEVTPSPERETVIRFTGDPARPYWVHAWK